MHKKRNSWHKIRIIAPESNNHASNVFQRGFFEKFFRGPCQLWATYSRPRNNVWMNARIVSSSKIKRGKNEATVTRFECLPALRSKIEIYKLHTHTFTSRSIILDVWIENSFLDFSNRWIWVGWLWSLVCNVNGKLLVNWIVSNF